MNTTWRNNTILCVDDEESVRDTYARILSPAADDFLAEILHLADDLDDDSVTGAPEKSMFNLLLASSGEEAIEILKNERDNGRRISAGFFDMRMPGGIDGYETIKRARELDSDLICCVVTAYTDRDVHEIRSLFTESHQDELLYIKKPFSVDELDQTAVNMLSSWNRKRKLENHLRAIEKQRNGLRQMLHAISAFNKVPPHSLKYLTSSLLFQLLSMVEGEDGYCILFAEYPQSKTCCGIGRYEHDEDLPKTMSAQASFTEAFATNSVIIEDGYCSIPFSTKSEKLGAMRIESANPILDYLDPELLDVFKTQVTSMIMSSTYHEKLVVKEQESLTDELTGLYNRRFYSQRLKEEFQKNSRSKGPITIAMIDIDNFKNINDKYGHDVGDRVLQSVGNMMQMAIRNNDFISSSVKKIGEENQFAIRYGGEEFSLVLFDTESDGASIVAERLRKQIEQHTFRCRDHEIRLTVSVGLFTKELDQAADQENFLAEIYQKADAALYHAKATGKNKIVEYSAIV